MINDGMWSYLFFSLVLVLVMTPFWLGLCPPPNARCLIRIRNGGVSVAGEAVPRHVLSSIAEILQNAGIEKGFIAITPNRRVKFSYQIPKTIQQRLRNVLFSP
ncbi:MAG: hypothetical protein QM813_04360 [Verrucomicrobiota bacterium]